MPIHYDFSWEFKGEEHSFEWVLTENDHNYCRDHFRKMTHRSKAYERYIMTDPCSNGLRKVAMYLKEMGEAKGYGGIDLANFAISFVSSLPYYSDNTPTPGRNYVRYPFETIMDQIGDCEDHAILLAAIFSQWCYDVILIVSDDHVAVGLNTSKIGVSGGTYYTFNNRRYFFCESTPDGRFVVGDFPDPNFEAKKFIDVPILCNKVPN